MLEGFLQYLKLLKISLWNSLIKNLTIIEFHALQNAKKKILKSVYLIIIDYKRKIADNSRHYEYFFENIRLIFFYVSSILRVIFVTEILSF
jgi:hypothetical protein